MTKSYFEDFEKKYNRPRMNNITVGFSGIDPAPKNEIDDDSVNIIANEAAEKYFNSRVASSEEVSTVLDEIWDAE